MVFGTLAYSRRKWTINMSECEFDYVVLPTKHIHYVNPEKSSFTYSGLFRLLSDEKPSVIISNGFSIATTRLWLRTFYKRTPYMIWSGAIHPKDKPDSFLRRLHRTILIKRAMGFIAYGTKAKQYLVSLGVDPRMVEIAINTVDTEFYAYKSKQLPKTQVPHDGKKHLLYVGHLSPRKNVLKLLIAIRHLIQYRTDLVLDIVGDGEDRKRLEKYVLTNQLTKFVKFHGFKQKNHVALYMAQSDCFLFQTDFDVWGLVLVEAMAAGLPCISSIYAGATQDVIEDGVTGFAMDFSETAKVAEKIDWVLQNPHLAQTIGQNASHFIEQYVTIEKSTYGFLSATRSALKT